MNDFYKGVIFSILRKALTGVSAWAITNGWLTGDQATEITLGIAGLIVSVGLSLWDQYSTQLVKLAALTPGITTLNEAKQLAASKSAAPVTTASDVTPPKPTVADVKTAQKASGWLLAAVLGGAALASGCGGQPVNLRPVAIASETFSVALKGLQSQFIVWADAGVVPRDTEVRWQAAFKDMAKAGLAVDVAVRAGDHASVVANANAVMALTETLIADEVVKLSPSQRGAVSVALQSIRGFILIWQTFQTADVGSVSELRAVEAN